jgi:hypothetical protein
MGQLSRVASFILYTRPQKYPWCKAHPANFVPLILFFSVVSYLTWQMKFSEAQLQRIQVKVNRNRVKMIHLKCLHLPTTLINSKGEPNPDILLIIKIEQYHINNYFLARFGTMLALPPCGTYVINIRQHYSLPCCFFLKVYMLRKLVRYCI